MKRLLVIALALALMGHKCNGKPPHDEAELAVEQALFHHDVDAALRDQPELAVEVPDAFEGAPATVVFTKRGDLTVAQVYLGADEYHFVVAADGSVEPTP